MILCSLLLHSAPLPDQIFFYPGPKIICLNSAPTLISIALESIGHPLITGMVTGPWQLILYLIFTRAKQKRERGRQRERKIQWASPVLLLILTLGGNRTSQIHAPANWSRQRVYISYLRTLGMQKKFIFQQDYNQYITYISLMSTHKSSLLSRFWRVHWILHFEMYVWCLGAISSQSSGN